MSNTGAERQPGGVEQEHFVTRRIVVKIGSSTITEDATKENPLNIDLIDDIARQCSQLYRSGIDVVIVSSGAVACGRHLLSIDENDIRDKQVEAVYGQPTLIGTWVNAFRKYGVIAGQALITENDLNEAKSVLQKALKSGVVIVNANDAVSTAEMEEFLVSADNDRLAGFVANTIEADTILILTDVEGVLDANRVLVKDGFLIDESILFHQDSSTGTGGMKSKVEVLKDLANRGIKGIITSAKHNNVVLEAARGNTEGKSTIFQAR